MKNKGFTLVEVLAVIVILGLLVAIINPTVKKLISDSESELEKEQVNTIINATKKYIVDNTDLLPEENATQPTMIDTDTLIEEGVIANETIINPKTKEELWGCVLISYNKEYNQYEYKFVENCVPIGTEYVYEYKKTYDTFETIVEGYYKLEVWGAQGGYRSNSAKGGKGGFVRGTVYLNKGDKLYIYVGGAGNNGTCTNDICEGGYNGGGYRYKYKGGGGATDIRTIGSANPLNRDSLLSRIIVAGGGGSDGSSGNAGGYGGGVSGGATTSGYGSYGYGGDIDGFTTTLTPLENQATKNEGTNYIGGFGFGGFGMSANSGYGGAGGGGWYGGIGTLPDGSGDDDKGGGGGSGFVWTENNKKYVPEGYQVPDRFFLTKTNSFDGTYEIPLIDGSTSIGNSGNGKARITYLGKSI